jgi:methionyl-tRNA formyltransferase
MSNVGVMLLSNNENSSELYDWISQRESVVAWSDAIRMEDILRFKPQLVISYNYVHIVPADIIEMLGRRIINMHISFLPYNRGCSPNLWSFIDDTPKGVTIHQMSEKLDRGGYTLTKRIAF